MKTTGKNKAIAILKGIVMFLIVTMSLFHIFFSAKSPKLAENNAAYKLAINDRNSLQNEYLEALKNKTISIEEYYSSVKELLSKSKEKIGAINDEKRAINFEHSFRGRNSFHFWIFVFGLVSALFFFSCKSLHNDFSRGSTVKFHLVSITGIIISFFWFIHLIFLTQNDFNKNKYIILTIVCASIFSVFTYFLVKYYTYKDQIILKQLSLLQRIKTIYYHDLAVRAVFAEKTGQPLESDKSTKESINEFDTDFMEVVKNI
ncbi:hypothetical protein [Kordia sp.]|uniref:hypothetical protein n=1 Tax=Kordia sp. TaxID=1965332 RepID=UPI0025C35FFE|nr:hypothetical protein [Kordia sp.]MCH2197104.1 hypothetical protein [Kordia sp.]